MPFQPAFGCWESNSKIITKNKAEYIYCWPLLSFHQDVDAIYCSTSSFPMEEAIFKEIGVTQDNEDDILARVLTEQKANVKDRRQRLEFATVANSIVENITIGRDELDDSLQGGFGVTSNANNNDQRHRKRFREVDGGNSSKSDGHFNKVLNELIINSTIRTRKHADIGNTQASKTISTSINAQKFLRSSDNILFSKVIPLDKSSSQKEPQQPTKTIACPNCNREFDFKIERLDELLSEHLSLCGDSGNRPKRNRIHTPIYQELSDECEWMDETENDFLPESVSNSDFSDDSNEAENQPLQNEGTSADPSKRKSLNSDFDMFSDMNDDWEENDYIQRIAMIESESLEKDQSHFGATVFKSSWNELYPYQQIGCEWLFNLYQDGLGGILADEMGLGKTAQVCTHFNALTLTKNVIHGSASPAFLIVCPATVLQHWLKEFYHWAPTIRVGILHNVSKTGKLFGALKTNDILKVLRSIRRSKVAPSLAIVTTYESLRKHKDALMQIEWTGICLDEGQKIRNPNADITLTCKLLPSYHRVLLSGTPIQNSLRELWSLFDFVFPGRLGTLSVFEQTFAASIRAGGYANATKLQYEIAVRCATTLQSMVRPYMLRRKKDDLILVTELPAKTEQVLFCQLSEKQKFIYQEILSSSEVQRVLSFRTSAFRAINTLRKLCNHPVLVYQQGTIVWQIDKIREYEHSLRTKYRRSNVKPYSSPADNERTNNIDVSHPKVDMDMVGIDDGDDDDRLKKLLSIEGHENISWHDSGKMLVLSKLLPIWKAEKHKVLIFSQTTTVLHLLQGMMEEMKFSYLRLDGSTDIACRSELIASFNQNPDVFVMLLTTRTGGVGISLTAANRVVLFDPDWNPMTDIQARERAWRLGQKREVVVYRLITKGTIEEKIYQRQIFKLLISNRVLENSNTKSIISKSHLRELFELSDHYKNGGETCKVGDLPTGSKINLGKDADCNIGNTEFDVAPHVDNDIHRSDEPFSSKKNSTPSSKDYLLLKALFDGDAITDVYDHEYLEPGARKVISEKNSTLEKRATDIANQAMKELQSSSQIFQSTLPDRNVMGGHVQNINNSLSSSSLLESIRTNKVAVQQSIREISSHDLPEVTRPKESQPRGVAGSIRTRILALFESSEQYNSDGLKTAFILSKFRDLGDQYAPLFKSILRDIARLDNGVWKRKKTS